MKVVTQHFSGTSRQWREANPKLYQAVWGFEITPDGTVLAKLGDGVHLWNDLPYWTAANIHGLPERLAAIEELAVEAKIIAENDSFAYPVALDSDTPTAEELQAAYEAASGKTGEAPDMTILEDPARHKAYKYFKAIGQWVDMGGAGFSQFTNTALGMIKGSENPGEIAALASGAGRVNGWPELLDNLDSLETTVGTQAGKIGAVQADCITRFEVMHKAYLADQVEGYGRDLMAVLLGHPFGDMTSQSLRNEAIAEVMAKLHIRLNNNGELDDSGISVCRGLSVGDYLDGLDLSGIAAAPGGTAPQPWNDTYKNNRLVLSGFNTYKGACGIEITHNHLLFTFRNAIAQGQMNTTLGIPEGYNESALRKWLEGASGDGTGPFATGLKTALGGSINYLFTIQNRLTTAAGWKWIDLTVFPPSEPNVIGDTVWSDTRYRSEQLRVQFPIFQKSLAYMIKRYNGTRSHWWLSGTQPDTFDWYSLMESRGGTYCNTATYLTGVSPAFCIA